MQQLEARNLLSCETSFCGDTNLDGKVDFVDFLTLSRNFGSAGSWTEGDFGTDGYVGFDDFLKLSQNYGQTVDSQSLISVHWEKTLDPFSPGAVWVGEGHTDQDEAVTVQAYDLIVTTDGSIERLMFDVTSESGETTSLHLTGKFTPGDAEGSGSMHLTGEQSATLRSTTADGLVSTTGELQYTDENGNAVSVTWSRKQLDPFNPLAVWAGHGTTRDGNPVDVRAFDFLLSSDGNTIERAIFEVTTPEGDTTSLRLSGEFTPGSSPETGSILMTGERGATLHSTTVNGLVSTSGQISFLPQAPLEEEVTVRWDKTVDPFAAGAVWVGNGITGDGETVTVRAYGLNVTSEGVIEQLRFDVVFPNGEVTALRMTGTFTPDESPGSGTILVHGELSSLLESTTVDGLLSTAGRLEYTAESGKQVSVTWTQKQIDPLNPLAVWMGSGTTSEGDSVDVRALDFVLGADGQTIERAIFEVTLPNGQTQSMLMSGMFTPGIDDGSGKIELHGEQNSMLQSETENGLITTSGEIVFSHSPKQ